MAPLRVLHLVGSPVSELYAEISRLYAADCLRSTADPDRYEFVIAHVSPDGRWRFPSDLAPTSLDAAEPLSPADALTAIAALEVDVMVPQLFCLPGMTHYRALFDVLAIPYVGNRPDVMALGADKAKAKAVVAAGGVRVPAGHLARPGDPLALDLPVVVKPVDADNSFGVTLVRAASAYDEAVVAACEHGERALVETYVELGREVRCGVVDIGGELVCLPLEEYAVDAETKPIRDQADKLSRAEGELALVAKDVEHAWIVDLSDPVTARVHAAARLSYAALGCRHYGLFDFRVDPDGEPWFLEAGLYCSFARTSVVAVMAGAAGITLEHLFSESIRLALDPVPPSPR